MARAPHLEAIRSANSSHRARLCQVNLLTKQGFFLISQQSITHESDCYDLSLI